MSRVSVHSLEAGRLSGPIVDKYAIIPILAFSFASIASPLIIFITTTPATGPTFATQLQEIMTPRPENKIVWPLLAVIAVVLAVRNWSRLTFPPHIISLFAYLAFAGASTLWAFRPEISFQRFVLQTTILAAVVFPTMLAARGTDIIRGLFICLAFGCFLNFAIILNQNPIIVEGVIFGYPGYFNDKNALGSIAAITFMLALHESLYSGHRRVFGIVLIAIATEIMIISHSKGALGLGILAPILAGLVLIASKTMRVSPAIVVLPIPVCYWVLSIVLGNVVNRISYYAYGNYTLTGRTYIWEFVNYEIARRPFLGWGYQSFWLVGPDGPSFVNGSGWVGTMPHGHNGYLDTILEIGYLGFAFLIFFVIATLHAIGRVANRDSRRAWLLLSLAMFVILANFLESRWMRGMDMVWLIFAIVAAEAARYWSPSRGGRARHKRRLVARRIHHGAAPRRPMATVAQR